MVRMLMCDKNTVNIRKVYVKAIKAIDNSFPTASCVYQDMRVSTSNICAVSAAAG